MTVTLLLSTACSPTSPAPVRAQVRPPTKFPSRELRPRTAIAQLHNTVKTLRQGGSDASTTALLAHLARKPDLPEVLAALSTALAVRRTDREQAEWSRAATGLVQGTC